MCLELCSRFHSSAIESKTASISPRPPYCTFCCQGVGPLATLSGKDVALFTTWVGASALTEDYASVLDMEMHEIHLDVGAFGGPPWASIDWAP